PPRLCNSGLAAAPPCRRGLLAGVASDASSRRGRLARVRQRRQDRLDLEAQMLERGRQRETLAEVLERLVGREPGADRRDLEEDAARLAKVDRLEVEAVDDRRHGGAGRRDAFAPGRMLLDRRGPRDVMHGPGAADAGAFGRVVCVEAAAPVSARLPAVLV